MRLEEIVSLRDLRAIVKEKFKRYQDVKDPRVSRSHELSLHRSVLCDLSVCITHVYPATPMSRVGLSAYALHPAGAIHL